MKNGYKSAEERAKEACDLPSFKNINIAGIKEKVAEILNMIGRVDSLFSTYTKHDISHINTMIGMLDWIIPDATKKSMSSADWLMTVLAIYFHDLGMITTHEEFTDRMSNGDFRDFLDKIYTDINYEDYVGRAESMNSDEKDRFFYQEYVRYHHASRIREWITGNYSYHWGGNIKSITEEISKIMDNLPTRFREDLAVVCESHHKDDLNDINKYPLAQRYGSHSDEIVNVQYAAFLLRTTDLLHVTKDRTPSVMYKIINFSDLKSVEEWDKQRGTFSVNMKGRTFKPDDKSSHIIEVSADFTKEAPFFALTEYITWADSQIKQTKSWADKSQELPDGVDFSFPWHTVKGNIRVEGNLPHQMRFELDRGRLLNLLVGHTIYNDATVAIRELLQNAIDAVRFQYYNDLKESSTIRSSIGRVLITWEESTSQLIIEDNGTGMDLDVIQNHLLKVGSSFYNTPQFQIQNNNFSPISKFGIGVLTCFMVSDSIEIVTYKLKEGKRIRMTSVQADYLLKNLQSGDPELIGIEPHGTKIKLIIRPSIKLTGKRILSILQQWIMLPSCEVSFKDLSDDVLHNIGFKTAREALHSMCFEEQSPISTGDPDNVGNYDIITKEIKGANGSDYEIAFLVKKTKKVGKGFYLDGRLKISSSSFTTNYTGVYIEGIKVDKTLPEFERARMISILSVKGNKNFRTTVSRSNLEHDEEYYKVAQICIKSFFEHIEREVYEISVADGHPLSQASSAGSWLYGTLKSSLSDKGKLYLNSLHKTLPYVVVENINSHDKKASRQLITIKELQDKTEFWTVESRVVDYFGVISRDISKEINVSEYVGVLNTETSDVNCIVTDVIYFGATILESHTVEYVEFSQEYERTFLKWVKKGNDELFAKDNMDAFEQIKLYFLRMLPVSITSNFSSEFGKFLPVVNIKGDVTGINGVLNRLIPVLSNDSVIGVNYTAIRNCLKNTNTLDSEEIYSLMIGHTLFSLSCYSKTKDDSTNMKRYRNASDDFFSQLSLLWQEHVDVIIRATLKLGVEHKFEHRYSNVIGDQNKWFQASTHWFDWNRSDRNVQDYGYPD